MSRSFQVVSAVVLAAALGLPAATVAAERAPSPRVITDGVTKQLKPAKANRLARRAARNHRYPKGPRLSSNRGLARSRPIELAPAGDPTAQVIAAPGAPILPTGKIFGFQGDYTSKKGPLVQWINYTYATIIPRLGGTFSAPAVYETRHGGATPQGCGPTYNGIYCPTVNTIGFSGFYGQAAFDNIGDAAFAGLLAHEFGHGAQQWLRLNGGLMRWLHYSEGFADCMAGGWLAQMYNWGYVDSFGRGDWREYLDVLENLSDRETRLDNHGAKEWRHAAATYGWNYGMRGCANWGAQLIRG